MNHLSKTILFFLVNIIVLNTSALFSQQSFSEKDFVALYDNILVNDSKTVEERINDYFKGRDVLAKVDKNLKYEFLVSYHWFFRLKGFPDEASKIAKETFLLAQQIKDYHYLTSVTQHLSDFYANKKYIDSALTINKKLIGFYEDNYALIYSSDKKNGYGYEAGMLSAYNNMGLFYDNTINNKDSAYYYYKIAKNLPELERNNDFQFLLHSVNDNIAQYYIDKGRSKEASLLFEENFNYYKKTDDNERWIRAGLQWVRSDINNVGFEQSEKRMSLIKQKLDSLGTYNGKLKNEILYTEIMESLYSQYKKVNKSIAYSKQLLELTNASLAKRTKETETFLHNLNTFNRASMDRALAQFKKEKKLREREQTIRNSITVLLIITILTALFILYLLYTKNKLRLQKINAEKQVQEEKANSAEARNQLLKKEVNLQQKDLSLFASVIAENQKWGNHLLEKMDGLKVSSASDEHLIVSELKSEIKQRIKIEQNNLNFQNRVDILNSRFFEKLLDTYPNLTKTELKLCSLIRLGLDNNDIAMMQNISVDSVYRSRTRLRKKLGTSSREDLNVFLKRF